MHNCFWLKNHLILWRAHVFFAWYSPWHCVLHLFLNFSAENGNKGMPIWDYFGFSHMLHLLLEVFRKPFSLWIIADLLSFQATYTDAPCENRGILPSAAIVSAVSFAYTSLTSSENWTIKNASPNKMSIKFYIPQWKVDNVRTKNTVTPLKKGATCFYVIFRSI